MAQLISNLPIGARVKFGKYSVEGEPAQDIIWLVAHTTSSTITLLTEKSIDLRCFDAPEQSGSKGYRNSLGNNLYSSSNIDQWLNSNAAAGEWYVAQHTYDNPPSSGTVPYTNRPGFLNAFTNTEINAVIDATVTTLKPSVDGGGVDNIIRKVFLPSVHEIGADWTNEGLAWSLFHDGNNPLAAYLTTQAHDNTKLTVKPSLSNPVPFFTRSPQVDSEYIVRAIGNGTASSVGANMESNGIRPALNLPTTLNISDTTDSDGCYKAIFNSAPPKPSVINLPNRILGGRANTIYWNNTVDPEGDTVTYQLECSYDGGSTYSIIYTGQSNTYSQIVPFGTSTICYRVKATDPSGESSDYITSATITVINNNAPVISGSDSNLGVKSSGFTGTYTITDANQDIVTVTEAIDGVRIRSLVAPPGEEITYGVTENTWLALPNGSHTLTISATDGIDTSVRTYTFTKLVNSFKIMNATPWVSSTMPSRIMLVITRNIPSAATFKVEVCNNGYDASPTWEDCTDAVMSGLVHVFNNKTKTATNWGVKIRVTVERNGATGACYVSAIGGNFE